MKKPNPAFPFIIEMKGPGSNPFSGKEILPGNTENEVFTGMSVRTYLMAHAPAEPQPWFEPYMPKKPDPTIWIGESGNKYHSRLDAERAEGDEFVRPVNSEAIAAWEQEKKKQRYIQWPAAWADEMMKQLLD